MNLIKFLMGASLLLVSLLSCSGLSASTQSSSSGDFDQMWGILRDLEVRYPESSCRPVYSFGPNTVGDSIEYDNEPKKIKRICSLFSSYRKNLKSEVVTVAMGFPFLSSADQKKNAGMLKFYKSLMKCAHSNGLKVLVQHDSMSRLAPDTLDYYTALDSLSAGEKTKKFKSDFIKEVSLIFKQVRPDYLSVLNEPTGYWENVMVKLSMEEWTDLLAESVRKLDRKANRLTKLGAGIEMWMPDVWLDNFTKIKSLDYFDVQIYYLIIRNQSAFATLEHQIPLIRKYDSKREIFISEFWPVKSLPGEILKPELASEMWGRGRMSDWADFDARFYRALSNFSSAHDIGLINAEFGQRLFFYYDDPAQVSKPYPLSWAQEWEHAEVQAKKGLPSPVGTMARQLSHKPICR